MFEGGKDAVGSLGGSNPVSDLFTDIPITSGDHGINYLFGEGRIKDEFISKRLFLSSNLIDMLMADVRLRRG